MVADIHGACHLQHRPLLLLGRVDGCRRLGVAEHVQHTVVADPVAAPEVPVGIVVKHAPAEGAADVPVGQGRIQHAGVAQGVLPPVAFIVKGFRGEHVAVVLGDEVGLLRIRRGLRLGNAAPVVPLVDEIIVGVHILQKTALAKIPHAARRPGGIQPVGRLHGPRVEAVVVLALVDPHAPQKDAWVVAVLEHHLLHILHRLVLPGVVADMLPSGDLGKDEKADLVAPSTKAWLWG